MISIAIATYNGEKYLREQLDSIYAQTYKQLEVVVTDDCSTDGTVSILEEYRQKYGLKYYVNLHNLGFVKNFERAISLCTGDYIALADQDDVWFPGKLFTLLNAMMLCELSNPDKPIIIHHDVYIVDENLKNKGLRYINNKGNSSGLINLLFGNPKVQGAASMFNRKLKNMCFPLPDDTPLHDLYISYVCECFGVRKYISEPLMLYRQHANNQIGAIEFSSFASFKKLINKRVVLADNNEIKTVSILRDEFKHKLSQADKNIINDFYLILGNDLNFVDKIRKVKVNHFNCDRSVIKLIIKIIRIFAFTGPKKKTNIC